jgi:murein DD-endopeptidase MepM/ murein hydrolase activator NlpD
MKRLLILYKYIVIYKGYLIAFAVVFGFIAFGVNYNQRIRTLVTVDNRLAKIDKIDTTTVLMFKMLLDNKKQDSIDRVIINHLPTGAPLSAENITKVSSEYGKRKNPITGLIEYHAAKDFSTPKGSQVFAAGSGIVSKVTRDEGNGKYIEIDHGIGYKTLYAHLSSFNVVIGDIVNKGDMIGNSGNTGFSSGAHLHYVVYYTGDGKNTKVNPGLLMQL